MWHPELGWGLKLCSGEASVHHIAYLSLLLKQKNRYRLAKENCCRSTTARQCETNFEAQAQHGPLSSYEHRRNSNSVLPMSEASPAGQIIKRKLTDVHRRLPLWMRRPLWGKLCKNTNIKKAKWLTSFVNQQIAQRCWILLPDLGPDLTLCKFQKKKILLIPGYSGSHG